MSRGYLLAIELKSFATLLVKVHSADTGPFPWDATHELSTHDAGRA